MTAGTALATSGVKADVAAQRPVGRDGGGQQEGRGERHRVAEAWPAEMPSQTMIATPTSMAPIAASVGGSGRSFRNTQERSAEKTVLKARMKTRLAVVVLKTAMMKVSADRP